MKGRIWVMSKVDKRTIEATYVRELLDNYANEYPTFPRYLPNTWLTVGYSFA